ncbi:hypothetical protein PG985_014030 [Apiospora marii]|uniref:Uncharacterized protein n=1 Tax=Apiospora marii TaxID=335849 RepID=A0ABR1R639_9PEZI
MFYFMNLHHSIKALEMPLEENIQLGQSLRHLALPLFDIAHWPDEDKRRLHDPSLHHANSPWLLEGLSLTLSKLPRLETIRLVVGRLFSVPFGVPYSRIKRREISASTALITTRTQLRDLAKSQPRDAYGFSDYTAFVASGGYQWPIDFPFRVFHPWHQQNPTPLPRPSRTTEIPFDTYDPFFHKVLGELRRLGSPPLYPPRRVDVRLVVDLDSNANRAGPLMRPRDYEEDIPAAGRPEHNAAVPYGEYRDELVPGYDRYFAVSSRNVLDWYEDVSGHARSIKGREDMTQAERDADDPDFAPTKSELADLSDGSGPGSAYGAPKKKKRKSKAPRKTAMEMKTGNRKTAKSTKAKQVEADEESDEGSEYLPPDYSEDDSPSD